MPLRSNIIMQHKLWKQLAYRMQHGRIKWGGVNISPGERKQPSDDWNIKCSMTSSAAAGFIVG